MQRKSIRWRVIAYALGALVVLVALIRDDVEPDDAPSPPASPMRVLK